MVLTQFVGLPEVKERFAAEFKALFDTRNSPRMYLKKLTEDKSDKQIIGIYFECTDGKLTHICDSDGRQKEITCAEDLTSFLAHGKYRGNLCFFYDDSFNIRKLADFLPDHERNELITTGMTYLWVYTIQYSDTNFFQIFNKTNYYKFYNLYPFFNMSLEQAGKDRIDNPEKNLDFKLSKRTIYRQQSDEKTIRDRLMNAIIIQKLADSLRQNPDLDLNNKIIHYSKSDASNTVGTAFDYLFRFLIKAHNPTALERVWRAEDALEFLSGKERKKARSILAKAKKNYAEFLKTREINDEILTSAMHLAELDGIFWTSGLFDDLRFDVNPDDIT